MTWEIEFSSDAQAALKKIDRTASMRLRRALDKVRDLEDPGQLCEPLKNPLAGLWKKRSGDYRAIIDIQRRRRVLVVVNADHRSRVYATRR